MDEHVRPQPAGTRSAAEPEGSAVLEVATGLARLAAISWWHVAGWTASAAVAGTSYVAKKAADGESATAIVQDTVQDLRAMAWQALGLPGRPGQAPQQPSRIRPVSRSDLEREGAELMRRASDVQVAEEVHPAFVKVLAEITPDEARVLRLLARLGPQPTLDVRRRHALGFTSEPVAEGLNMIAEHAGCQHLQRAALYLTNLHRLGLIENSAEPVADPQRYQVVEAQPAVAQACERAGRMPKIVHRSIQLTGFGAAFCATALPPEAADPALGLRP